MPQGFYRAPGKFLLGARKFLQGAQSSYRAPKGFYKAPKGSYRAPEGFYKAPKSFYKAPKGSDKAFDQRNVASEFYFCYSGSPRTQLATKAPTKQFINEVSKAKFVSDIAAHRGFGLRRKLYHSTQHNEIYTKNTIISHFKPAATLRGRGAAPLRPCEAGAPLRCALSAMFAHYTLLRLVIAYYTLRRGLARYPLGTLLMHSLLPRYRLGSLGEINEINISGRRQGCGLGPFFQFRVRTRSLGRRRQGLSDTAQRCLRWETQEVQKIYGFGAQWI